MSELRDLTSALRTFDQRITSIEECLLVLVRNSEQEAEWRHEQRNLAQQHELERSESVRAIRQVQEACGAISHRLVELVERLDNQAAVRLDDVRALNERVRRLELNHSPTEEITRA